MKKQISIFCALILGLCILWSGCGAAAYPLNGEYTKTHFESTSTKSKDQIWSSVLDFFIEKGIIIKVMDKSSGYILSEPFSLLNSYTREYENGKPIDKNAAIVIGDISEGLTSKKNPHLLTANVSVRLIEKEGQTNISISLLDLKCQYYSIRQNRQENITNTINTPAKSTGVFENQLLSAIK
jgi:hypothetical protein